MVSDFSKAEAQMTYAHWHIHRGELYFAGEVQTTNAVQTYLLRVGAIPLHISLILEASAGVLFELLENVSTNVAGSPITAQSYNRVSPKALLTTAYKGPTFSGGTVIKTNQAGFGSSPGHAQSGSSEIGEEYIFKPNTDYVIRLTPSASATIVNNATFYELALV